MGREPAVAGRAVAEMAVEMEWQSMSVVVLEEVRQNEVEQLLMEVGYSVCKNLVVAFEAVQL